MADQERRMLFDIRGRRKRVVQVAYAGLAVIMALSLFTVVGPTSFTDLFGTGGTSTDSSEIFDDQIQRIQRKLAKDPEDEALLVQLTRAQFQAANANLERDPTTQQITGISEEAVDDFRAAGETWQRYLKTDPKEPNATVAGFVAQGLGYSVQAARTADEAEAQIKEAVEAQKIFAAARPNLNSYLTLALYSYAAGDEEGGDAAARKAEAEAPKVQRRLVKQTASQYRAQGQQFQKQVKAASEFNPAGGGQQALQDPLGGLSGGTGLSAPAP